MNKKTKEAIAALGEKVPQFKDVPKEVLHRLLYKHVDDLTVIPAHKRALYKMVDHMLGEKPPAEIDYVAGHAYTLAIKRRKITAVVVSVDECPSLGKVLTVWQKDRRAAMTFELAKAEKGRVTVHAILAHDIKAANDLGEITLREGAWDELRKLGSSLPFALAARFERPERAEMH